MDLSEGPGPVTAAFDTSQPQDVQLYSETETLTVFPFVMKNSKVETLDHS